MADDYKQRSYRSNDPYRRPAEPARPSDFANSSDPLAELARLIGQNDPFAEQGRAQARDPRDSRDLPPRGYAPAPAVPEWPPATSERRRFEPEPRYETDPRYAAEPRGGYRDSYPAGSSYAPPRDDYAPSRDYAPPRAPGREAYAASDDYARTPTVPQGPQDDGRWQDEQRYDDVHAGAEQQVDEHGHDGLHAGDPAAAADDEQYYAEDAPLAPHEEETYDDAPSAYRRGGLATALALIGCALLGTAGAYAYRSYSSHAGIKEPPPVITADNSTPTKVVPAQSGENRSNKPISERFANANGNEQLVSRQEEPVAVKEPGTAATPRVVLPAPVQPTPPGPPVQSAAPGQPGQPAAVPPAAGGEPKRVRTVTIRPDGADPSGRPVANTTAPAPRATTPPAPRAPAARQQGPGGGPLSLDPQPGEPPRARTATAPAPRESFGTNSGGYVVQLSSQKSEAEAQASFRAMQSRYPIELGSRQPIIRRADLGAKGVVYRTNVGPFQSAQEAQQFCANYKAAGGQCIVPTN
jgi:hypothetical protein